MTTKNEKTTFEDFDIETADAMAAQYIDEYNQLKELERFKNFNRADKRVALLGSEAADRMCAKFLLRDKFNEVLKKYHTVRFSELIQELESRGVEYDYPMGNDNGKNLIIPSTSGKNITVQSWTGNGKYSKSNGSLPPTPALGGFVVFYDGISKYVEGPKLRAKDLTELWSREDLKYID